HPVSPSVLVDGLDIHDCEYGIWRPVYQRHAYRGLTMEQVTVHKEFAPEETAPMAADYPRPLDPVDDLPPATVITHVTRPAAGRVQVRGTTSDNGSVRRVRVNGVEAHPLATNYAEWEAVLEGVPAGAVKLTAHAEDAAGNVERLPHTRVIQRGG